ncbi:TPA: hypothetical protein NG287_002324 [Vibrio parahaemolyticus]|nr:hypothetical protein [Vibrio parahaemolyticus]HCG7349997.1 hypothetical protein [Vibrio parahaemolyticus]
MNSNSSLQDQELLQPWLTVIGMLTVFWSPIERYVDQCVSILFESGTSNKKPMTLSHKLAYIHRELPSLGFNEVELSELIAVTKSTVQIRDVCVHGVIDSFDANELKIGKVQGRADKYSIEMFTLTSERLNKSANNLMLLNEHWRSLAENIYNHSEHS